MSAYNWILAEAKCPGCKQNIVLRCQTHIASDFGGVEQSRFSNQEYTLGQAMRWWPETHQNYDLWRVNGSKKCDEIWMMDERDAECCHASCPLCKVELYAVIHFRGPRACALEQVGLESEWPEEYWK